MLCIALLECARPRDVPERSCGWAKLHYVSIPHDSDFTLGPILSVLYRGSDSTSGGVVVSGREAALDCFDLSPSVLWRQLTMRCPVAH